jgi:hypothetical protein
MILQTLGVSGIGCFSDPITVGRFRCEVGNVEVDRVRVRADLRDESIQRTPIPRRSDSTSRALVPAIRSDETQRASVEPGQIVSGFAEAYDGTACV